MSYAKTLNEKRRSILLAVGELASDLPIGNPFIGFYDRNAERWSEPESD